MTAQYADITLKMQPTSSDGEHDLGLRTCDRVYL